MQKREEFCFKTISEREFRIGSLDAMTGSYWATKIAAMLAPMFAKIVSAIRSQGEGENSSVDNMIAAIDFDSVLKSLTKQDFVELQSDCLKVAAEQLPSGYVPVLNPNNSYGVEGLTPVLAIALMVEVLTWNFADFFAEGSPLMSFLQ